MPHAATLLIFPLNVQYDNMKQEVLQCGRHCTDSNKGQAKDKATMQTVTNTRSPKSSASNCSSILIASLSALNIGSRLGMGKESLKVNEEFVSCSDKFPSVNLGRECKQQGFQPNVTCSSLHTARTIKPVGN